MKFATLNLPVDRRDRRRHRDLRTIEAAGGWWVRFGRAVLIYAADGKWRGVVEGLGERARSAETPEGEVRKGDMHLVLQKGRTFQLENPGVRVILDKGRYLVVELSRSKARKLAGRKDPCFHIEPLRENSTVFEERPPMARAPAVDEGVAALVALLSQSAFEAALTRLVSIRSRLSTGPGYAEAAEWVRSELAALGLAASIEPISVGGRKSSNVVASLPGSGGEQRQHLLIVAHLDSVNHPGGPSAPAPGADDNASGSAGVLTLARALAGFRFTHNLTFILFGGEEQGLHGSTQYIAALPEAERRRIRGVLNMDMIGSVNAQPPAVLLEGAALSQRMIDGLANAAAQFTGLVVQTSLNPFASDHVPFIQAGIPAVLTIEGADGANDAIHTANDTLERVDPAFAMEILRMNAGFLATEAGVVAQPQWETPPGAEPQPVGSGCGYGGTWQDESAMAQAINRLAGHYHALFAQYARLHRDGMMQAQDLANWHAARLAYESLVGGAAGLRGG